MLKLPQLHTLILEVITVDHFPEVELPNLTDLDISTFAIAHEQACAPKVHVGDFLEKFHYLKRLR